MVSGLVEALEVGMRMGMAFWEVRCARRLEALGVVKSWMEVTAETWTEARWHGDGGICRRWLCRK